MTAHFTRLGGYDVEAIPDFAAMRALAMASIDSPLDLLAAAHVEVVGYGCTSATLGSGLAFNERFREDLEARIGIPAVTTAGALIEAVSALGASHIGFTSPYVGELNRKAVGFFAEAGIQVVECIDVGTALSSLEQGRLTPRDAFEMGLAADHPDAEVIVIGCTDFRAVEAIGALESELGKPVVTSNQALVFGCLTRMGIDTNGVEGGGRLFAT